MQKKKSLSCRLVLLLALGTAGLIVACAPGDNGAEKPGAAGKDVGLYNSVAQQFTDKLLLPGFNEHAAATTVLQQQIARQCGADSADETALRAAWTGAFLHWQTTNFLLFGPLTEERALRLQFYPDKRQLIPARLQKFLQNPATISAEKIAKGTAPAQGYPALEQLIFGVPVGTENRCELMSAIAAFVAARANQLAADWQEQAKAFSANGEEAVGRVVDSLQRAINRLHERRLAEPLGLSRVGERQAEPNAAEAYVAKQSLPAMLATIESLQAWLTGPFGLQALAVGEEKIRYFAELERTFVEVITAINAETLPLEKAVVEQPAGLMALHAGSLKRLKHQLTQLNTVLHVYIGFNAEDGD